MNEVTAEDIEKCRRQVISQFGDMTCAFDLAATLTFKRAPASVEAAESDFRHLMSRLNRAIYGNNWLRKSEKKPDQRVAVFPVHEDGYGRKRLHYHCAFATPEHITVEKLSSMIGLIWSELRKGSEKHNKFVPIYDEEGWLDYILKEVNLLIPDNNNKIDARNMHTY